LDGERAAGRGIDCGFYGGLRNKLGLRREKFLEERGGCRG